jgi:tight adherence protein B
MAALSAMAGTYLLFGALVLGRRSFGRPTSGRPKRSARSWLAQAGVVETTPTEFALVVVAASAGVGLFVWLIFGSLGPAVLSSVVGAFTPVALYRSRRQNLQLVARDSWPYLIEEIRLLTGSLGRSIPVATLDAGRKATTAPMRAAFQAAAREWHLSTDFGRTVGVLKELLADATADVVCETLLAAHEIGGADIDRRLAALIDDRRTDLRHRQEAASRQAGVRFARWFVLIVPLGMAVVGLGIGDGRAAYRTAGGQVAVVVGLALTGACWWWASRIMRLPAPKRVLSR